MRIEAISRLKYSVENLDRNKRLILKINFENPSI